MTLHGISDKANTLRTAKKTKGRKLGALESHWNFKLTNPEAVSPLENLIAISVLTFKTL